MYPILFNSGDITIHTVYLFIVLFFFSYVLLFWMVSRQTLKTNTIFDISIITLLIAIACGRILGMLSNMQEYLEPGWSLLPVSETDGAIRIAAQLPWSFIRLTDGNLSYIGIFLGLVLGMIFIYQNSNQRKTVYVLFDKLIVSYAIASVFLLLGIFLHGADIGARADAGLVITYPDGTTRYPIQLIQIGLTAIFLVLIYVLNALGRLKAGLAASIYFLLFGVSEFMLRTLAAQYTPGLYGVIDYYQLVALILAAVGIILAVSQLLPERAPRVAATGGMREPIVSPGDRDRQQRARERARLYEERQSQSGRSQDTGNRFVVSFADRMRGRENDE
ncbi:MAG: Prolipoprotein diacylglyceryl transferase [candidate division WS6 bacterium OLB20]|uniref:Prolipoprotein diacylglyceryl transferase n=1 Tax=candidate division WS6 bacterium OLB20 TaxID=1617426 RepID=A0A136LY71_9BACT|nr:MAG: Prolipoprotein diacylglyceryl transferase [candidate division WS6 bacterium OLB20]